MTVKLKPKKAEKEKGTYFDKELDSFSVFICRFMSMCENIHACVRLGLHAREYYVNV